MKMIMQLDGNEVNPEPLISPFNGIQQCLLDPTRNKPEDFFNALFEDRMCTIMAEKVNKYAQQRKQVPEYFYLNDLFTKFSKNIFINHTIFRKNSGFTYIKLFILVYEISSFLYH